MFCHRDAAGPGAAERGFVGCLVEHAVACNCRGQGARFRGTDTVTDTAKPFGNMAAEATMTSLDLLKIPSTLDLSPHLMVSWPQSLIILK